MTEVDVINNQEMVHALVSNFEALTTTMAKEYEELFNLDLVGWAGLPLSLLRAQPWPRTANPVGTGVGEVPFCTELITSPLKQGDKFEAKGRVWKVLVNILMKNSGWMEDRVLFLAVPVSTEDQPDTQSVIKGRSVQEIEALLMAVQSVK